MRTILHFIPTLEGGGAERQLALLAREQAAGGAAVHVGLRRRGPYAAGLELAGVHLHPLGDRRGLNPRLVGAMRRLIRRLHPDVVQTWLPQADVCGGLAARLEGCPWVMTERASPAEHPWWWPTTRLRRWLARGARSIVANSQQGARYWQRWQSPRRPVVVVPNGVDVDAVRRALAARTHPGPDAAPALLSAGRLIASKAHDVTLRAFAQLELPGARLLLIGDGPERAPLEALARHCGVHERTDFLPFHLEWWQELAAAAVVVSLSRQEGAPNVVLEAMAAGVPLVVSDIPEHREFLDAESAQLVPLDDPTAAARALRTVLREPDAARRRAERAEQRVRLLSGARAAAAYDEVYAGIAPLDGAS